MEGCLNWSPITNHQATCPRKRAAWAPFMLLTVSLPLTQGAGGTAFIPCTTQPSVSRQVSWRCTRAGLWNEGKPPYQLGLGSSSAGRLSTRRWVKQVPEDDRLLEDDDAPSTIPNPSSILAPVLLASALVAVTIFVYALGPHVSGAAEGGVASWDQWSHELAVKLTPPGYNFYESLLSGGFAGISRGLSRIITFPLDTVKTRQQAVINQDVDMATLQAQSKKVDTSRLFDGLLPMLLIAGPANAAFFVTHDYILAAFTAASLFPRSGLWAAELLAATLASLPANAIRIPAEVTKQRVQAGVEKTAWLATQTIVKTEGLPGLYVGGKAHLLRELPFNAIQFLTFQNTKTWLRASGVHVGVVEKALLGALAAGIAGLATQPFDVIKTAEMIDERSAGVSRETWGGTVKRIYGRYGVAGLYLGLTPRLLLCGVGGAFYFLASEAVKGFFQPMVS